LEAYRFKFSIASSLEKEIRNVSRNIWNFSPYLIVFIYLFHHVRLKPWRCSADPWLENTVLERQWYGTWI